MRRILVIDDDAAVRSVLRRLLQRTGHEVLEAGDGAEGIALLQRRSFDLVILDTHMPGLGGLDTIPVLRKRWPTMKILAVSGTDRAAEVAIAERAIELGADQFLGKPFERSEVLRVIDTLLAQA